jgi:Domain of unknown function DUF29
MSNKASVAEAPKLADLYESDETAWLEESSRLIRAGKLDGLDCEHLASYLEDMAIRDRREVKSRLRVLVVHLLKWHYQPEKRSRSWVTTIGNQQFELAGLVEGATLRRHAEGVLAEIYPSAVKSAAIQTRLPNSAFPAECPFALDQILTAEIAEELP